MQTYTLKLGNTIIDKNCTIGHAFDMIDNWCFDNHHIYGIETITQETGIGNSLNFVVNCFTETGEDKQTFIIIPN